MKLPKGGKLREDALDQRVLSTGNLKKIEELLGVFIDTSLCQVKKQKVTVMDENGELIGDFTSKKEKFTERELMQAIVKKYLEKIE